jgi:hypothetical protein
MNQVAAKLLDDIELVRSAKGKAECALALQSFINEGQDLALEEGVHTRLHKLMFELLAAKRDASSNMDLPSSQASTDNGDTVFQTVPHSERVRLEFAQQERPALKLLREAQRAERSRQSPLAIHYYQLIIKHHPYSRVTSLARKHIIDQAP